MNEELLHIPQNLFYKDVRLLFMIDVVPINNIREVYFLQKMFRNFYEGPVGYSFKMNGGGLSQM